jgi:hypothetical protein
MNMLETLDALLADPDGYWVAYDFCLENGWAFPEDVPTPMLIEVRSCVGPAECSHRSDVGIWIRSTASLPT